MGEPADGAAVALAEGFQLFVPGLAEQIGEFFGDQRLAAAALHQQAAGAASDDRFSDSTPFQAGGWVSNGCSLGPRIRYQNQYMILTAGHCGAQSTYRSYLNNTIGSLYTTALPENAYEYGDWLMIYGKSYSAWVFNGPVSGPGQLQGQAINWGGYPTGGNICSSGITTGQVCSWIVTQDDVQNNRASTGGLVTIGPMLEMRYDPNGSGNPNDCYQTGKDPVGMASWVPKGTSRAGDSGGANYHRTQTSPQVMVTYDAITTGQYWYQIGTQNRCLDYASQMKGVKNFAPSASW